MLKAECFPLKVRIAFERNCRQDAKVQSNIKGKTKATVW